MAPLTTLDWIFLAVLGCSLVLGAWRGLVYEVLSVLAWVGAFLLAQWLGPMVAQSVPMGGASEAIRYAVGFVLVFVAAAFIGGLLAWLIKRLVESVGLRPMDRVLGALFGLVRGVVLLLALTVVVYMTPLSSSGWWHESTGAAVATTTLRGLGPMLPQDFGKYLP